MLPLPHPTWSRLYHRSYLHGLASRCRAHWARRYCAIASSGVYACWHASKSISCLRAQTWCCIRDQRWQPCPTRNSSRSWQRCSTKLRAALPRARPTPHCLASPGVRMLGRRPNTLQGGEIKTRAKIRAKQLSRNRLNSQRGRPPRKPDNRESAGRARCLYLWDGMLDAPAQPCNQPTAMQSKTPRAADPMAVYRI
jgi:hypothetical protein